MKKTFLVTALIALVFALSTAVLMAGTTSEIPSKKQTKLGLYMTAIEAYEHMQAQGDKALFLDVRSRAEVNFLGMPTIADANVPYMELSEWFAFDSAKSHYSMDVNSDFAAEVERRAAAKGLTKDDTIILMCRSGSRSAKAVDLLAQLGYTHVYTVVDGYEGDKAKEGAQAGQRVVNGWRNAGLPWTYKLDTAKMYRVAATAAAAE